MPTVGKCKSMSSCHRPFNHLPKNVLIWRISVRSSEILRKIVTVYRAAQDWTFVRLRAEDQVFVFSRGETPHDATVSRFPYIGLGVFLSTTVCIIPIHPQGICNALFRHRLRSQQGRAEERGRSGEQGDRESLRFQGFGRARGAGGAGADDLRGRRFQAEAGDRRSAHEMREARGGRADVRHEERREDRHQGEAADTRQGRHRAGEGEEHREAPQGFEDEGAGEHPGDRGARFRSEEGRSSDGDCAGAEERHRYSAAVPEFSGLTTPPASPAPLLDEEGKILFYLPFFSTPRSFLLPVLFYSSFFSTPRSFLPPVLSN